MPRSIRIAPGGMVFHVLNRGVNRMQIFHTVKDYLAFDDLLEEVLQLCPMRVLAYCLMPNHWHMVLWPENDGDLPKFMHRLTLTHAARWKHAHETVGTGHLYQGRYKSFVVGKDDEHFITVVRYVERNALRKGLVERAEDWQWSSLWRRHRGGGSQRAILSTWPEEMPGNWVQLVNEPLTDAELEAVRLSAWRGRPYGLEDWVRETARKLHLENTLNAEGQPGQKRNKITPHS